MQGQAADLSKAFDNIPVRITFAILERLGMEQRTDERAESNVQPDEASF